MIEFIGMTAFYGFDTEPPDLDGPQIGRPAILLSPGSTIVHLRDAWYRCEEPERPEDQLVVWHYRDCAGCRIAAEALGRRHPGDPSVTWLLERIIR